MFDMTLGEYAAELVRLYKVRAMMSGNDARRYVLDMLDDVNEAFVLDIPPQEFFNEDLNAVEGE